MVQPIKSKEDIQRVKEYLLTRPERFSGQNIRDYTIFVLGVNMYERCKDILHLRFYNILDQNGQLKECITILRQKTGETINIPMTPIVAEALTLYFESLGGINYCDFVFPSRNNDAVGNNKAMTVGNFYKKMKKLESELELNYSVGSLSMKKTGGRASISQEDIDELHMNNQL